MNNMTFQALIVQLWKGGDTVPIKEIGAQEFHQLELRVVTEEGTIPVTRSISSATE